MCALGREHMGRRAPDAPRRAGDEGDAVFAASIRTHLKKLSPPEIDVLTRHGAALVEDRIRRYAPELLDPDGR